MTKKEMELEYKAKINNLNRKVEQIGIYLAQCLTINEAKKRDYIVRNKYIGKITDKKIKEDFKAEIEKECGDKFDSVTNNLLNYRFIPDGKNILDKFSEILEKYEYKQIVLDTYGDKKDEK